MPYRDPPPTVAVLARSWPPVNHRPALNTEISSPGRSPSPTVLGDSSECVSRTARHRRAAAPGRLAIPVIGQGADRESVSPAVVEHLRQGAQGRPPGAGRGGGVGVVQQDGAAAGEA